MSVTPPAKIHTAELTLPDIYRDSKTMRDLRTPQKFGGKCGRCEFREVCGGSRSHTYAVSGDALGSDPSCVYTV